MEETIAIIAAHDHSSKFPDKETYPLFGRPLIEWAIDAAQRSARVDRVYVTTDDDNISKIAKRNRCKVIRLTSSFTQNSVHKVEAMRFVVSRLRSKLGIKPRVVVSLQATTPEIRNTDIDTAVDLLTKHHLWEAISVGQDGIQNGAVRVIRRSALYNTFLSDKIGVIRTDCIDVRSLEDIALLQQRYDSLERFEMIRN